MAWEACGVGGVWRHRYGIGGRRVNVDRAQGVAGRGGFRRGHRIGQGRLGGTASSLFGVIR
ncbi:hypothetical protein, partial [Salmonella enterica]|uniref:hypothetical protein n=1 Tax=Salmonella enterica TaxID=28901 RepID=UPI00398C7374